jgi:hypothetical protein
VSRIVKIRVKISCFLVRRELPKLTKDHKKVTRVEKLKESVNPNVSKKRL